METQYQYHYGGSEPKLPVASPPTYLLLIDSRVSNTQDIINAKQPGVHHIVFEAPSRPTHSAKLIKNIEDQIAALGVPAFTSIGLVQHNDGRPIYEMFGRISDRMKPVISDVATRDPDIQTWNRISLFITMLRLNYGIVNFDMMACALYSDPNWKHVIDKLTAVTGVTVRASTDDTGAASLGGDWFLESHTGVNLKDIYFTDAIENYTGILVLSSNSDILPVTTVKKLLLIDHTIPDIHVIINSMNDDTYCLVFNSQYDTEDTILSKLRFLSGSNRYILDAFHYADAGTDAASTAAVLTPSQLHSETDWQFYPDSAPTISIYQPVFFQRAIPVTTTTATTTSGPIMNEPDLADVSMYLPRDKVRITDLDEIYEIAKTAGELLDNSGLEFECVGIIQHAPATTLGYKLMNTGSYATIENVSSIDPNLSSWSHFGTFIERLKSVYKMTTLDMMACALYTNPDWKYIIDQLALRHAITIRASLDNTGNTNDGGNWILETAEINLTDVYFTNAIHVWAHLLPTSLTTLRFDGVDDAVNMGVPAWSYSTQFRTTMTVECWFKTADTNNQKTSPQIVTRNNSGGVSSTSQFSLYMLSTGEVGFGLTNNSNTGFYHNTTAAYKDALWHHVAVTYNSATGTKIMYIDGVAVKTDTNASFGLLSNNSTVKLVIGSDGGGVDFGYTDRQFRGQISDVRIWNVVRSASEIAANYGRRLVGNETGLVGYWKLNQGIGTGWASYSSATDSTSNRVHGTLTNMGATPSGSWVVSNLNFQPRISTLTLGANNGVYNLSDSSFSFIDPSSNSLGDFTYAVSPTSIATVANGAATTKTIYATSGAISIPTLSLFEFPEIASLSSWQIDISFTVTGGAGTWRALIGDMFNNITNSYDGTRGWGLWISTNNRIYWSWVGATSEPEILNVVLNTPYVLTAAQSSGTITLTLTNLAQTFNSSLSISNLVALYNFDSTANDSSVNNNHLTNVNSVSYNTNDYKRGTASAQFNKTNYFEISNDGRFSPDNLTISFWVKPVNSNGVHQAIASCRNTVSGGWVGWFIYIGPTNNLEFITGNGTGTLTGGSIYSNFGGTITSWVHIAITLTKSTSTTVLYVNGRLWTSASNSYVNNPSGNLRIGAGANESSASFFMGVGSQLDDFRIYSKILSESEIGTIIANSSYSASFSVGANVIGKGPVAIGGWQTLRYDDFPGTISYVNVSVPTNQRVVTLSTGTGGTPATVTATQDSSLDFGVGSQTAALTVNLTSPTIGTLTAPAKNFGDASFNLTAPTSNSSGAFTYTSSNTAVATVTSGGMVTIVGTGSTTITATQAASGNYTSGSVTASLVVSAIAPTISALSVTAKNINDASFSLIIPDSSSNGLFSFTSSNTSVANISGNIPIQVNSLNFDGINDHIEYGLPAKMVGTTGTQFRTTFTLECWFKHPGAPQDIYPSLMARNYSGGSIDTSVFFIDTYDNKIRCYIQTMSGSTAVSTVNRYDDSQWHHMAATYNATIGKLMLYIDGLLVNQITNTSLGLLSNTTNVITNFKVGGARSDWDQMDFRGFIAEVRVWNIVRSESQIYNNYSKHLTGYENGLILYSKLNQGIASGNNSSIQYANNDVLTSGEGYTGTLVNFNKSGSTSNWVLGPTLNTNFIVNINSVGTTTITATQAATTNYTSGSVTASLVVSAIAPTIGTLTAPAKNFGDASFNLTAPTSNSSGAFTYTSSNTAVATVTSGGMVTVVGAGSTTITAIQAASGNYASGSVTASLVVSAIAPTIGTLTAPAKNFGDASFNLTAPTSNSSGAFSYTSSNTSVATVTSGGMVTVVGAGTTTITATQAATTNYSGGSVTASLVVSPIAPTIGTLTAPAKNFGDASFNLTAPTSNSSGAFTYTSSNTAVATVTSGGMVTVVGTGTTTITATQAATTNYSGGSVTASLVVSAIAPTIGTLTAPAKIFGDASFNLTAPTSNSSGAFSYTSSNTSVATVTSGGMVTVVGAGSTTITATQAASGNYASASVTASLVVSKATPVLSTFTVSTSRTYGAAPFSALAYPTSNISDGAIVYTSTDSTVASIDSSSGIITLLKAGYVNFIATQQATAYYNSATKTSNTMTVYRQILSLTRSSPTSSTINKTYGDSYFNVIATNASNGGTITYETDTPSVAGIVGSATAGVISVVSVGTATITARREQTDQYTSDPVSWTVEVARATTTLTGLSDVSYNVTAAPFTVTASSASDGAVTYSLLDPSSSVLTIHPTTGLVTLRSAGSAVIVASQAQGTLYLAPASITATITVTSAGNALQGATITNTSSFASVNLQGASLAGVSITNTAFTAANLTNANLTNAVIVSANFASADLSGATLAGATITGATFTAASLKNADLSGAILTNTAFTGSDLSGARLTGVDASGASFANARLTNVDMTGANIANVNFTNTSIKGANITDVSFSPLQKLQLLKNSDNRDIGQIIIPAVTGTTVLAAISESSPLRAIENLDLTSATVAVVVPTTSTSPTAVLPDVVLNVVDSDKFYLPINESEFFQIEGVKYYATGGVVRNYLTNAVVEVINYNGTPVWLLAGSIVGLVLQTNTLNSSSFVVPSRMLITTTTPFMPTTLPASNNTTTPIIYSSDNTNVATIDASSGEITITGAIGFVRFTATQVQNATYEPGVSVSNTLFVDRSVEFILTELNQTFNLSTLATLDASSISIETTDATAVFYVRLSDINNVFMYQSDASDVTNVIADDIKYYVFHRKWPTELKLNPTHAMLDKSESSGMLGVGEGYASEKSLIKHDFIRYIALRLFNTIHGVDLFHNEAELLENSVFLGETVRNNIDTIMAGISTTSSSGTMAYDASGNKYLTNDASGNTNLCREMMRHMAAVAPSRFYGNVPNHAGLKNVPFLENDTLQYKLVVQAAATQNLLTGVSEIPSRSYTIKLVLKNTVNASTNVNTVVTDSEMYPNAYPYSSSMVTYAPTTDSSNVYTIYSPPAPIPFSRFGYNGWYYTNSAAWVNVAPAVRNHVKWLVGGNTATSKVSDLQYIRVNLKIHNTASLPYLMVYTQAGSSRKYAVVSGNGSLVNGTVYSFYMNFNSYAREPATIGATNAALAYTVGSGSFANNETITSIAVETDSNAAAGNIEFTLSSVVVGELSGEKEYGFEAAVPVSYP